MFYETAAVKPKNLNPDEAALQNKKVQIIYFNGNEIDDPVRSQRFTL